MPVKGIMSLGLVCALAAPAAAASAEQAQQDEAAVQAAEQWVGAIDEQQYGQSWENAADVFQRRVAKPQWEASAERMRQPLGKVISREIKATQYTNELRGA